MRERRRNYQLYGNLGVFVLAIDTKSGLFWDQTFNEIAMVDACRLKFVGKKATLF